MIKNWCIRVDYIDPVTGEQVFVYIRNIYTGSEIDIAVSSSKLKTLRFFSKEEAEAEFSTVKEHLHWFTNYALIAEKIYANM